MVGHVEDDDVGMKVRIEVAARMFGEAGEEKPAGRFMDDLALDAESRVRFAGKWKRRATPPKPTIPMP